ncbi:MAG: hypothetical protein JXN64_02195 [Spirochaetes bacterium]|nr:hypothetical protein [Spirochaetota bacterium]
MNLDNSIIDSISRTIFEIIETAQNVNKLSHVRKQVTSESLMLLSELLEKNSKIIENYNRVFDSLQNYISGISQNITTFRKNIDLFVEITYGINSIKSKLENITSLIDHLINIVITIKKDTEEINVLATNASIVSSKYNTSVFQILSSKFNSMSNYINQNLETIINYVNPIKENIDNLISINSLVFSDIENGYHNYLLFLEKFGHQESVVGKQVQKAEVSGEKIKNQKNMLADINTQVFLMDSDAGKAIEGSANVMKIGENLKAAVDTLASAGNNGKPPEDHIKTIDLITEKGYIIGETATNVNVKSKSQLDFSFSSLEFCKSIIEQSKDLENTVNIFNKQSIENNSLSEKISSSIRELMDQLNEIEKKIISSNETLKNFIDNYFNINNILFILKDILKLMKIIGIYSRIEASRDPVLYEGFLTISKNIQKLQKKIKNSIPMIESNIKKTKSVIELVNNSYQNISSVFFQVRKNSIYFTNEMNIISQASTEAEKLSVAILDDSLNLDALLIDLEKYLNKLTEVVKEPIEGSAKNIQRGKLLEEKGRELKRMLL